MIGKAAIFLKHRAGKLGSKVGGMFRGRDLKNKATIAKFKAKKVGSTIGSKAKKNVKYIKKNPIKSATIGTGVAGLSYLGYKDFSNTNKKMQKRLISEFGKLPKSDPRYKALKKAGYV